MIYRRFGKRLFDLVLTLPAVLVLAPVMALLAVLVRVKLGRPVVFRQRRPGLHGEPFEMWKFRSMTDERDAAGNLLADHVRLTSFGRWLRATSLDELPSLMQVLAGSLSLVGPRPLMERYLGRYTPEQFRRHDVKPGVTGWAQINGRNAISWDEKFRLDLWYVDHLSFGLDLRILWLTVWKVVARHDVNASDDVPMPEFWGTQQPPEESQTQ